MRSIDRSQPPLRIHLDAGPASSGPGVAPLLAGTTAPNPVHDPRTGEALRWSRSQVEVRLARLIVEIGRLGSADSAPAELDRLLGSVSAPTKESLERTRVVSVAIGAAAGLLVAAHPYIARLVFGR